MVLADVQDRSPGLTATPEAPTHAAAELAGAWMYVIGAWN